MKKLLSMLLAALMVIAVFPVAIAQDVTATTTENVAYLNQSYTGESELNNDAKPYATFEAAYAALCPAGGKIVLTAPYVISAAISGLAHHYGVITVTAEDKNVGYLQNTAKENTLKCGGPVTFKDIRLVSAERFYLLGNYNHITIDTGVSCEKSLGTSLDGTNTASNIAVLGGTFTSCANADTKVTVRSGNWRAVVGGGRTSSSAKTDSYHGIENGTYQIFFEGGYAEFIFGTNWATSNSAIQVGGQPYIYFRGGTVKNLYFGGQYANHSAVLHGVVIYTGGNLPQSISAAIRGEYSVGQMTIVYGGDINVNGTEKAFHIDGTSGSKRTKNIFKNGDALIDVVTNANGLNVIPLAAADATVWLDPDAQTAAGDGSEENPVKYLHQAIAMLSVNGGTVKLAKDYTPDSYELSQTEQFVEPYHGEPIVIDGNGFKLVGVDSVNPYDTENGTAYKDNLTVNGNTYDRRYGFASYWLNGNTTFKNITFDNPRDFNITCNFNELIIDNVTCTGTNSIVMIEGGAYLYAWHYDYGNRNGYNHAYKYYNVGDTKINVNSGKFTIYGFTRFGGGYINSDDELLHYPGTANINITGGEINNVLPGSSHEASNASNRKDITSQSAVINISGDAKVAALFTGGLNADAGSVKGNVVYNISDNVKVGRYGTVDNCDGIRYYNVDTCYADYLFVKNRYADDADAANIVVSTDLADPDVTFKAFDVKVENETDGEMQLRARYTVSDTFFDDEDKKYNIVEMGVLVKLAAVSDAVTYIKGANGNYYAPVTIGGEASTENYSGNIAKSVSYVQSTEDATKSAVAYYQYDGTNPVVFTAPITEIYKTSAETKFVFVPYLVMHNADKSDYQVFYGADAEQSASLKSVAESIINDANSSADSKTIAQSVLDIIGQ